MPRSPRELLRSAKRFVLRPKVIMRDRLVVVDETDHCANPIFLIGLHRSGTTLVRQIVDSHSRIACPPESKFLFDVERMYRGDKFREGLPYLGFDDAGMRAAVRRFAAGFFEAYRQSKGKARWADKTPAYALILPFVEEIFGPGAQYVMLYRHPFDVISSLRRLGWDFFKATDDPFRNAVLYVREHLDAQFAFDDAHPSRCHTMKYEDLNAQPERVLRRLFEFLGEPWEPGVLQFNQQKHDYGLGDPTAQVTAGFQPRSGMWHDWTDAQKAQASEHLAAAMARLGYQA